MPTESPAPAAAPPETEDYAVYEALFAALSENARGRAFLAEYASRNRSADTDMLLVALSRLEGHIARDGAAVERLRDELRTLLIAIRLARPEIEAADVPAKAAKLGALLDLLDSRIEAIAGLESRESRAAHGDVPAQHETPPDSLLAEQPDTPQPATAGKASSAAPAAIALAIADVNVAEAEPPPPEQPAPPPSDPLAGLNALSEDERLAVFT